MSSNHEKLWEIDNLPNRLTIFRVLLVPVVSLIFIPQLFSYHLSEDYETFANYAAGIIFIIAAVTDFFDGFFARRRNLVTMFGSFLDPIADKFLVVTSLIILQALGRVHPYIVVILIMREFYITSLRLLASTHQISVPVGFMGKLKTAVQMVAIPLLLVNDTIEGFSTLLVGTMFIYAASAFSLYSALQYSLGLISVLKEKKSKHFNEQEPVTGSTEAEGEKDNTSKEESGTT